MRKKAALKGVIFADKIFQTALDLVFLIVLLIGIYFIADTIYIFDHARAASVGPYRPAAAEDVEELQKTAKDAVGWITIDDTSVDYPIMQGTNNMEYLNKDPYGEYSLAGSIFLDSRNAGDFSDPYSVVYGHHMSGGYMFGALDSFEDEEYFREHDKGTLITSAGEYAVSVVAFLYTDANNEEIFNPENGGGHLEYITYNAMNQKPIDAGKRIVALTTCKSPTSTRRMVLILTIDERKNDDAN